MSPSQWLAVRGFAPETGDVDEMGDRCHGEAANADERCKGRML
jgi:hypothetical protein